MLLPLTGEISFNLDDLNLDLSNSQEVPTNLQQTADEQFISAITAQVEQSLHKSLQKFEINNAEILLNMDISDDFSISINNLKIWLGEEHDFKAETVGQYVKQNFYKNAEVIVKGV